MTSPVGMVGGKVRTPTTIQFRSDGCPYFSRLFFVFKEQYTELATAVDEIAELIRVLVEPAPGFYTAYFGSFNYFWV